MKKPKVHATCDQSDLERKPIMPKKFHGQLFKCDI